MRARPALGGGSRSREPVRVASLTRPMSCRTVGHLGVQEDHMDLHTVHMESHLTDPDVEVSVIPPLEDHGLITIPMDPMAPTVTLEEPSPLTTPNLNRTAGSLGEEN